MGRGELHLTILLENMRREGYEMVSKPRVVFKDIDGVKHEPIELVTADIEEGHRGGVMRPGRARRAGEHGPDGRGRVRLEYRIPARGLIGFTNEFLNLTRGSGLIIQQHLRQLRAAHGRYRRPQERCADLHGRR